MSHEHTCTQCGTTFCARRADARFCTAKCRMRHMRGIPPTRKSTDKPLRAFLERHGFAHEGVLNVRASEALAEVNAAIERVQRPGLRMVLQPFTEFTLKATMKAEGIVAA